MSSFDIVDSFERKVADFAGAKHGISVNTGTSAIFLCLQWKNISTTYRGAISLPARTFISVPMECIKCGYDVEFQDYVWKGVYPLTPFDIYDSACRFRKNMYKGGLHCLSFQARKILNIGEGGMILTDDDDAAKWLKKARYSGREEPFFKIEDIDMIGWQLYMTPEKAGRGLHLMDYVVNEAADQLIQYPDLREVKYFKDLYVSRRKEIRAA